MLTCGIQVHSNGSQDHVGGLIETDPQTTKLSVLAEAKIKVGSIRITDTPQVIGQKFNQQWLTIQLIPLFTVQKHPLCSDSSMEHPKRVKPLINKMNLAQREKQKTKQGTGRVLERYQQITSQKPHPATVSLTNQREQNTMDVRQSLDKGRESTGLIH